MITSHFLDSGSFSLSRIGKEQYGDFWFRKMYMKRYLDAYIEFVSRYQKGIDVYANVDVIGNAEASYRNLKYLEEAGLRPIPVVHFGTSLEWLKRYIDEGYSLIGIGGMVASLVGEGSREGFLPWLNKVFDLVCHTSDFTPAVKLHGFGLTNHTLLTKYPWWSVDSTAWCKRAGFGMIIMPFLKNGVWDYCSPPTDVFMSLESANRDKGFHRMQRHTRKAVEKWLGELGLVLEEVVSSGSKRAEANLLYFEKLRAAMPLYPRKWKHPSCSSGFGFREYRQLLVAPESTAAASSIYYSGAGAFDLPKRSWLQGWSIMTTFWDSRKSLSPSKRLRYILEERVA